MYYVLRFLSRLAVWINYRKIYLEHFERIPPGNHVIFGLNHPTAFLDPIILATHLEPKGWFMLRADKFINKPVRWFLHQIHNLPIHREGDGGRNALRGNIHTMAHATDQVVQGQPTVILSEGLCRHERRLRPIQRGTARMLMQAHTKAPTKPIAIMPTAINYTAANDFRSSATLTCAEPIFAADYAEAHQADPRQVIEDITDEIYRRLRKLVIHVADPSRDELADKLLPLIQHSCPDQGLSPTATRSPFIRQQWRAVEVINGLDEHEARQLERETDAYLASLMSAGLSDSGVALPGYATMGRAAMLWLTGPLAMMGWLIHYPLAMIVQRRIERTVKNPQFFASVRWGLGLAAFVGYALGAAIISAVLLGWVMLVIVPPLFYGLGYFFLIHRDAFELWKQAAKTKSVPEARLAELQQQREALLSQIGFFRQQPLARDAEST